MEWDLLNLSNEFKPGIAPVTESNNSFHIIISKEGILKITGEQPWRPINEIEWHWLNIETYSDHYLSGSFISKRNFIKDKSFFN